MFAYAKGAARACDLSAELGRRAQKLLTAQPKLRAKGAPAALAALLDDGGQISERALRGLRERLTVIDRGVLQNEIALAIALDGGAPVLSINPRGH